MEYASGGELFEYIVANNRYILIIFKKEMNINFILIILIKIYLLIRVSEKESCKFLS